MKNKKLENYLLRLEKSLGPIPTSEKAEIITEIKSHVMDAIENDKNKSIGQILSSLGEPEQVANKYLLEKSLEPVKVSKHPIVKWITIGFLGTFGLIIFFLLILVFKFIPIVKIDEESGRIQVLGGLIDVQQNEEVAEISGEENLFESSINNIKIDFKNGKMILKRNDGNKFLFNCKVQDSVSDVKPRKESDSLVFDLESSNRSFCSLEIPSGFKLAVNGKNGEIQLIELQNHISVNLTNGKIGFIPESNSKYKYQVSVKNGTSDEFLNSNSNEAFEVQLSLKNGKIRQLDSFTD